MLWRIPESEWVTAKSQLTGKPDGTKLLKSASRLNNSFILINRSVYALKPKEYVGKGTYAKTKFVQDENGGLYIAKITYKKEFSNSTPISVFLIRKLELISSNPSLKKEQKTLLDLNLSKGHAKQLDSDKEIIVMEYLGQALPIYLKTHTLNNTKQLQFAIQMIGELDKLHSGRTSVTNTMRIHGDLKESNLTVDNNGNIHIIDFGSSQKTMDGRGKYCVGTPDYMAPEVQSQRSKISFKSDIYSLGVIFSNCFDNPNLEILSKLMRLYDPESRPALSLIKICVSVLNQEYPDLAASGYQVNSAKAVAAIILSSDEKNLLFANDSLITNIKNKPDSQLIKYLSTAFDYLEKANNKQAHGREVTRLYIRNLIKYESNPTEITKQTLLYLRGEGPYARTAFKAASTINANSRLAFFYNNGLLDSFIHVRDQAKSFTELEEKERQQILEQIKSYT